MWKKLTGIFGLMAWFSVAAAAQPVADTLRLETVAIHLDHAAAIYAVGNEQVYVVESGRHRLLKLSSNGQRLDSLGNQGFGNYQFDQPVDIDATNGLKIYVSDQNNNRIQVFDRRFQYLASIQAGGAPIPANRYIPGRLTVNRMGELFFYDDDSDSIIRYGINGEYRGHFPIRDDDRLNIPADLASVGDKLLLADPAQGVIHVLSSNGPYIRFIGGLKGVHALSIYGGSIWALTEDRLVQLDSRGRLQSGKWLPASEGKKFVDLSVYDGRVYLLTRDAVYRAY